MENKYYTPQIEDLRIGYICDYTTMSSTFDENDINIVRNDDDLCVNEPLYGSDIEKYSTWCNDDDSLRNYVRTKYLDKEDIESLGWVYVKDAYVLRKVFEMRNYHLYWTEKENRVSIGYNIFDSTLYAGNCPSINELKFLMKLLNIK